MNKTKRKLWWLLCAVLAVLALSTVLPFSGAAEASMLGYRSICPFAPISTVIALYLALTVHRYLKHTRLEVDEP